MIGRWWFVAAGLLCGTVCAQSVQAPALKAGDSWVYVDTVESGPQGWSRKNETVTVERIEGDSVLIANKQDG
jgi:hypothetical protein